MRYSGMFACIVTGVSGVSLLALYSVFGDGAGRSKRYVLENVSTNVNFYVPCNDWRYRIYTLSRRVTSGLTMLTPRFVCWKWVQEHKPSGVAIAHVLRNKHSFSTMQWYGYRPLLEAVFVFTDILGDVTGTNHNLLNIIQIFIPTTTAITRYIVNIRACYFAVSDQWALSVNGVKSA